MEGSSLSRTRSGRPLDSVSIPTEPDITPKKRRQPLDEILDHLNSRWNLDLPRLHGSEADRLESTKGLAKRCSARLRYLLYREVDLKQLLQNFDRQASTIHSSWKFKPFAELHVTPSRKPDESSLARTILKGKLPALTSSQKESLLACLDKMLEEPYQTSRNSDSFAISRTDPSRSGTTVTRASTPSTRTSSTMHNTSWVTKPAGGNNNVEHKTPAKPRNPAKRHNESIEKAGTSQKKTKTLRDCWSISNQKAITDQTNPPASLPETPIKYAPAELNNAIPSSNDTMVLDDDTMSLFPSTQDADVFQDPDLMRSMDSGYASGSPSTPKSRLSNTFVSSMLQLPTIDLTYEFVYEIHSLALSWNETAKNVLKQVREKCHTNSPSVEERLMVYRQIAEKRPYEPFNRVSWDPSSGLPDDKTLFRSLYQEATLTWRQTKDPDAGPFQLHLHAPRTQQSCRFHRMFGGHRFLTLNVPNWRDGAIPGISDPEGYQQAIADWLSDGIKIAGRCWRPFWVEDKPKQTKSGERFSQVHLFALTGLELDRPMSIKDFLNMHTPLVANIESSDHKLFARGKLGLSKTTPTVVLHKDEFLQIDDIQSKAGTVMNDGCGLMSVDLAIAIAQCLGLDGVPSAFQGRISGAKGMWLIDKRNTFNHNLHDRNFWIQITPSQLKILPHPRERECSDEVRTFDVSDWTKTLRPSSLNPQLINVLDNRGVNRDILATRLKSLTDDYYDELCDSINKNDSLLTHAWLQKYHSSKTQRANFEFVGGRPITRLDQIKAYLDIGFSPREHRHLNELVKETILAYLNDFVEKPRIDLARSTFAFMVPDMWGILAEGEVQLCLGQAWLDPATGIETTFIAGMDGLVARNPANHPSDIQRVKFVHYPELAGYSNLIFFSTNGNRPLADYLSGGDYDGDQAFVCWDPEIVEGFENFPSGPPDDIAPKDVYLKRFSRKLDSVFSHGIVESSIKDYLKTCLSFTLRPSYLGIVTTEHVAFVYSQSLKKGTGQGRGRRALESEGATMLAALAAFLVDALKQGYHLPAQDWSALRKRYCGGRELPKPEYLLPEGSVPDKSEYPNVLDFLRFQIARKQKHLLLTSWKKLTDSWPSRADEALLKPIRAFESNVDQERSLRGPRVYQRILEGLRTELELIMDNWSFNAGPRQGRDASSTFKLIQEVSDLYQKVGPVRVDGCKDHPFYVMHALDEQMGTKMWESLRASYLYKHFHSRSARFVWSMAGLELSQLKAQTMGPTIPVMARTYGTMKLNNKAVKLVAETTPIQEDAPDAIDKEAIDDDDDAETQFFDAPTSPNEEESPQQTHREYF